MRSKSSSVDIKILRKKRSERIGRISRAILMSIAAAGVLATALVAPNVLQLLNDKASKKREWYIKNVQEELRAKGLIKRVKHKEGFAYELTEKGEGVASSYVLGTLEIKKPLFWDGKWRVVMFDIKESYKGARDELRSILISLGFEKLQKSAWVHPYPCADVITLIKKKYDLGKSVLYLEVETLENDHWLRDVFFLR
ncbi:MAG TPA: hypothetical protein VI953_01210 [Candidatus Paceibacterota bacterium]